MNTSSMHADSVGRASAEARHAWQSGAIQGAEQANDTLSSLKDYAWYSNEEEFKPVVRLRNLFGTFQ